MGMTHYWDFIVSPVSLTRSETYTKHGLELFADAVSEAKECIDSLGGKINLRCGSGEMAPTFSDKLLSFNGDSENDESGESFILSYNDYRMGSCKTGGKPYDLAVCIVLLLFAHNFKEFFRYSSDADIDSGEGNWGDAKKIVRDYYRTKYGEPIPEI